MKNYYVLFLTLFTLINYTNTSAQINFEAPNDTSNSRFYDDFFNASLNRIRPGLTLNGFDNGGSNRNK